MKYLSRHKLIACKESIYLHDYAKSTRNISDLQHKPSERVDVWVEEVDPQVEEDAQEDHRTRQEGIITIEIGMTSKEMMKAVI